MVMVELAYFQTVEELKAQRSVVLQGWKVDVFYSSSPKRESHKGLCLNPLFHEGFLRQNMAGSPETKLRMGKLSSYISLEF